VRDDGGGGATLGLSRCGVGGSGVSGLFGASGGRGGGGVFRRGRRGGRGRVTSGGRGGRVGGRVRVRVSARIGDVRLHAARTRGGRVNTEHHPFLALVTNRGEKVKRLVIFDVESHRRSLASIFGTGSLGSTVEAARHGLTGSIIGTLGNTVGTRGRVLNVRRNQPAEGNRVPGSRDDTVGVKAGSDLTRDLRDPDGNPEVRCHGHAHQSKDSKELSVHDFG